MTEKTFIEKAIEGNWYPCERGSDVSYGYNKKYRLWEFSVNDVLKVRMSIHEILLRPDAWRAVGKVEGWGKGSLDEWSKGYKYRMHSMIDALCEGKTINQFLKTL